MSRCTYGLRRGGLVVECGVPAVFHVSGTGAMPAGLDIEGTKQVSIEGDYCGKHATTVKNRLGASRTTQTQP